MYWKAWPGQGKVRVGIAYTWSELGVRLVCLQEIPSQVRRNLRRLYRRELNRRLRRWVLKQWLDDLHAQRQQLGRELHKGLCQRLMVVELQAHLMANSSATERAHSEQLLLQTLRETCQEFARLFQEQLSGSQADSPRAQLLRELGPMRAEADARVGLRKAVQWAGQRQLLDS